MLTKINRLKKRKEFNYIYKKGQVAHAVDFSVHFVRAFKPYAQIGISVSKTVGNSVVRSRVKRIISEACRLNIEKFAVKNYVITAKPPIVDKKSTDIEAELLALLKKNHLLKEGSSTQAVKQNLQEKTNEDKKPLNLGKPKSQTSQTQAVKPKTKTEKIENKKPLKILSEQKVQTLQTKPGGEKVNGQKVAETAIKIAKKPKDGKAKRGKNV